MAWCLIHVHIIKAVTGLHTNGEPFPRVCPAASSDTRDDTAVVTRFYDDDIISNLQFCAHGASHPAGGRQATRISRGILQKRGSCTNSGSAVSWRLAHHNTWPILRKRIYRGTIPRTTPGFLAKGGNLLFIGINATRENATKRSRLVPRISVAGMRKYPKWPENARTNG